MAEQRRGAQRHLDGELVRDRSAEDPELEAIKARVLEMEEEAEKLKEVQYESERRLICSPPGGLFYTMTHEERIDADNRSVYVGNVDYGATADELEIHFNGCGPVNRVTILCDKFTGHPKGFAYIEFSDRDSVRTAMTLDETLFRGRIIKVLPKRTNMPGISSTDRGSFRGARSRGRGFRSFRFNSGFQGRYYCRPSRSVLPHPYGLPAGKRPWGAAEHRHQGAKRHPCLLLITPPASDSGPGPSGKQQR
ncbi:embryonic polyadenylate-binding protein 2 isoform X1 [Brienomyrus brachyistius]|uniref:embryonic polyadenylate-binding protein 2 isoform X1 n=1 Tax=Brienomyrus brachyistius TaxID=42636 RepID=UPI0020B21211|nr:embryonic polyadenylate-binding protein 2 isoform X1 [Brienomyrus brachyistius]XP_048886734.1 embryonic polyadenylate-binding protein 2 isoform X1 [Brienomyrus brachyistius]XP_048886735.1 embryonic polyadenylate-binding protein 2 isoform X1 [Brienomyrus brachyistius]